MRATPWPHRLTLPQDAPPATGTPMRRPTPNERAALQIMGNAIADDSYRTQFFKDLDVAHIEEAAPDFSRLLFHIPGLDRGRYQGQDSFRGVDKFPVEGTLKDSDGADVEVYLYHADGRVFELELLRPDGRPIIEVRWECFRAK